MIDLRNATIAELFAASSSTEPVPGGGTVVCLAGVLGIALILKAFRISTRSKPSLDGGTVELELLQLAESLSSCAEEDMAAFGSVVAALRQPKLLPDDASRVAAITASAVNASNAAIRSFDAAQAAIKAASECKPFVKNSIVADLNIGLKFLDLVKANALENIEANLAYIKDDGLAQKIKAELIRRA